MPESSRALLWVELIALLFGAGGAGTIAVRRFLAWLDKRRVRQHVQGLRDISSVYRALNHIAAVSENSSRAMVIRSRNNGGIPAPGCTVWVRILYEHFREAKFSVEGKWTERTADEQYTTLLLDIAQQRYVELHTADLPPSALRTLYEASGTAMSRIWRLHMSDTEMLYLSVNYLDERPLGSSEMNTILQGVDDLRAIFSHYHGGRK